MTNFFQVVVIAFASVVAVTGVDAFRAECPLICPSIFQPICATNGKEYMKFGNPCGLKVFNCRQLRSELSTYKKIDFEWCTTTDLDGVQIDLAPTLDADDVDPSCHAPCPMIYKPVCGSNGTYRKSFANECLMKSFNCIFKSENKNNWRVLQQGDCQQRFQNK